MQDQEQLLVGDRWCKGGGKGGVLLLLLLQSSLLSSLTTCGVVPDCPF